MKALKTIALLLSLGVFLIATPRPAGARIAPRPGIEGGLNQAEITYHADDALLEPEIGFRPAWWAGASLELPLAERWSIVTGSRYVEYGEVQEWSISGFARFRLHGTLQYLAFPLRAQWEPLRDGRLVFSVGPEAGYLVGVKWDMDGPGVGPLNPAPGRARPASVTAQIFENALGHPIDFFYPWNVVATAGVGYEIPVAGHRALLHLRYTGGLTDVARSSQLRRTVRAFELGAGWRW